MTDAGVGSSYVSVNKSGATFGVDNGMPVSVLSLLAAVNSRSSNGLLYNGNAATRSMADDLFDALNKLAGL